MVQSGSGRFWGVVKSGSEWFRVVQSGSGRFWEWLRVVQSGSEWFRAFLGGAE